MVLNDFSLYVSSGFESIATTVPISIPRGKTSLVETKFAFVDKVLTLQLQIAIIIPR